MKNASGQSTTTPQMDGGRSIANLNAEIASLESVIAGLQKEVDQLQVVSGDSDLEQLRLKSEIDTLQAKCLEAQTSLEHVRTSKQTMVAVHSSLEACTQENASLKSSIASAESEKSQLSAKLEQLQKQREEDDRTKLLDVTGLRQQHAELEMKRSGLGGKEKQFENARAQFEAETEQTREELRLMSARHEEIFARLEALRDDQENALSASCTSTSAFLRAMQSHVDRFMDSVCGLSSFNDTLKSSLRLQLYSRHVISSLEAELDEWRTTAKGKKPESYKKEPLLRSKVEADLREHTLRDLVLKGGLGLENDRNALLAELANMCDPLFVEWQELLCASAARRVVVEDVRKQYADNVARQDEKGIIPEAVLFDEQSADDSAKNDDDRRKVQFNETVEVHEIDYSSDRAAAKSGDVQGISVSSQPGNASPSTQDDVEDEDDEDDEDAVGFASYYQEEYATSEEGDVDAELERMEQIENKYQT